MKVKKLIEILSKIPDDSEVLIESSFGEYVDAEISNILQCQLPPVIYLTTDSIKGNPQGHNVLWRLEDE